MNKLIIVAVLFLISCSSKKMDEKDADTQGSETVGNLAEASREDGSNAHYNAGDDATLRKAFDRTFAYEDSVNQVVQQLRVNWLSNDSIEFILTADNNLCAYKLTGTAVNQYPGADPEVEEDHAGFAYPAIEYIVVDGRQLHSIRIEMTERRLAKISYEYATPRDECDPEAEALMKAVL